MGWLWGSNNDASSTKSDGDPLRDLDPSLRDFLEKESPLKYKTSQPRSQAATSLSPASQPADTQSQSTNSAASRPYDSSTASPPTLFSDGRYSHLWSTYKSKSEVENAAKTDQEKLLDVLNAFKERKAEIGRAAVENCSLEQTAISDCFRTGSWKARMTMCRGPSREFERCYTMQSRFLKALGYLSTYDRPPEVDEQIQMHADTLYHRMLERERAVEEAKAAGREIPQFPPILSTTTPTESSATTQSLPLDLPNDQIPLDPTLDQLAPRVKAQLRDRLKGLTPEERDVEMKAILGELTAGEAVTRRVDYLHEEAAKARRLRKEQGSETMGDRIMSIFGN